MQNGIVIDLKIRNRSDNRGTKIIRGKPNARLEDGRPEIMNPSSDSVDTKVIHENTNGG
jgi:hypothetical protein